MNDKEIELLIPVKPFCKVLGLCDEHFTEKREVFKATNALRIEGGEEYFSLPEYTNYAFDQLDSSWKDLTDGKSASDFANTESMTRGYLVEWTSILTWLLNTAVMIDAEKRHYFDEGFKMVIVDFQRIFYRLRSIFEFAYDLAYTGQISKKDEKANSPE